MPVFHIGSPARIVEGSILVIAGLWLGKAAANYHVPAVEETVQAASTNAESRRVIPGHNVEPKPMASAALLSPAFKGEEWMEVPYAMLSLSSGFNLLPYLNAASDSDDSSLGDLDTTLHLSAAESDAIQVCIHRFLDNWVSLQAGTAKKRDETTWSLGASPQQLEALATKFYQDVKGVIGAERGYSFRFLSFKSTQTLVNNPDLQLQLVDGGASLSLVGAGAAGLSFDLQNVAAKSPLETLVVRLGVRSK